MSMIKSYGGSPPSITLEVNPDAMMGVVAGVSWFGVTDGVPHFRSRLAELPPLKDDDALLPFFANPGPVRKIWESGPVGHAGPVFHIAHLCGYNWTAERYTAEAAKLESYGFTCLRSRRGPDGKYWESWVLHGVWAARGDLKAAIDGWPKPVYIGTPADAKYAQAEVEAVLRWLCQHCSFGTLDVSIQRAAMAHPE